MSRVFISGYGAVSPAGWGVESMRRALEKNDPIPFQSLDRPGWQKSMRVRPVPAPAPRPPFLAHPRLRRSSPITHYATAAALEAAAGIRAKSLAPLQFGIIACLQAGCVNYSCRFFAEVLKDPPTASPLLFPETVYAAPASHVANVLEQVSLVYTLVGDPGCFLQGVAMAAQWLDNKMVDACIVLGAEETHWILADALLHLDSQSVLAGGAGALCLSRQPDLSAGIELLAIIDSHTFAKSRSRGRAARLMREQLRDGQTQGLLCDGVSGASRTDAAENAAWADWTGERLSPKKILGEGLMAGGAWQCVAACDALANRRFPSATVSLVGSNQQAIGAQFSRHETTDHYNHRS